MAWRTIPSPLSKMKRRLDSTDATRGLQEIRVATWEDSRVLCFPSRRGLTPRHDEDLREPLVPLQGSQVSMRVARGSASWLSSHGRGLGPRDEPLRGTLGSSLRSPAEGVPTLQGPCGRSPKRRGSLRFLPSLEMRPSSIAPEQPLSRGCALSRLGAELELRRSGSSLGPSTTQHSQAHQCSFIAAAQ